MSETPAADPRQRALDIAVRRAPADTVVHDCMVLDVHTGLMRAAGIAIVGERIAYVGAVDDLIGPSTRVIDGKGRIAVPGLIDGHIHTYESHLPVGELARGFFRCGVTTIITDFYGEAVVRGVRAVEAAISEAAESRLNAVFVLPMPALYQDEPFLHTGTVRMPEMEAMVAWEACRGLNECFVKSIVNGEPMLTRLTDLIQAKGGKACGHGSEASEAEVQGWAGWVRRLDDHEAVSADEALDRLRAGIHVIAREGSGVNDVANIVRGLRAANADLRRVSFCTDLVSPIDVMGRGTIDYCVRLCIGLGVPPVTAVQMATINSAECHQIDHDVGSISPGRRADIILLGGALAEFEIDTVMAAGAVVVEGGAIVVPPAQRQDPGFARGTVQIAGITAETFAIRSDAREVEARVIGVGEGTIITRNLVRRLPVVDGIVEPVPEHGLNAIAAINRHRPGAGVGRGFVEGFGLRRGAMASTYNPHCQHLLLVGADRGSMAVAANECARLGGGFVVVDGEEVLARVPLPLYGLLSDQPIEILTAQIQTALDALKSLGCELIAPFHTLAFSGLPITIGTLKISSLGLIDVWRGEVVPPLIGPVAATADALI
ncbi:adenine deaminase C-terminal domain-containing protein [Ancylobacter sp. VNQ12]|uniref:adenine deaminase C-terminal domain-containing protein n=1 Tax=Ancylobacter sp. VNQ12 TaxID=3400920 RepID=UPI003C08F63F